MVVFSLSRYSFPSSTPFTSRTSHYSPTHYPITSKLPHKKYPTNGIPQNRVISSSWLENWKVPRRPKIPLPVLNYRASGCGCIAIASLGVGGGGSTMDRIVEKLKKFGYMDDVSESEKGRERVIEKGSVEDIFYVEEGMLPNTRGGFSSDSPFRAGDDEVRFPWEKPAAKTMEETGNSVKTRSRTFVAELTLPESELRRLHILTLKTKQKLKIRGAGVTQVAVDEIHKRWKDSEIVRIKVEGAPALNMKRMHEILERKTGGVIIWRSGTSVSLYRGVSYEVHSEEQKRWAFRKKGTQTNVPLLPVGRRLPSKYDSNDRMDYAKESFDKTNYVNGNPEVEEVNYENEIDKLLSDLGPRYTDWPGEDPLPVDADLLPNLVPGYMPPFRLLPYGVRRSLGPKEATSLRRIARTLPPHFAIGRSRQLEGLSAAIVKLWESSSIAKVALKRGVQLTTSERMAEDIKRLTGGILLSRNKDFLVFYRGKDFLSLEVREVLLERERLATALQDKEEAARRTATTSVMHDSVSASAIHTSGTEQVRDAGTLYETLDANAKYENKVDDHTKEKMLREAQLMRHATLVRKIDKKLSFAERKVRRAEHALSKVEEFLKPADRQPDLESITDEERFMFRKLGLKMKAFLLLGRRGVFDGTVENMHLHWKYRELVKVIVKAKNFEEVKNIALSLESESCGVLVSVDKISKGYAIIVFRGKDYERPSSIRPKNLLTKRKALARSIELQRREALLKNIAQLQQNVDRLRSELEQMYEMKDQSDSFYDSLDAAYSTEDEEDIEDEGEDAYLKTYNDESEDESKFSS